MSRNRRAYPKRIIPIKNPDKEWHEHWHPDRDLLNFPHPMRACFLGPPNVGKSSTALNLLLRADPPHEKVVVVHCDPSYTKEYDCLGEHVEMLDKIPDPEEFDGECKTLVILDDLDFKLLSKEQHRALSRLFGYVSTHKNVSVILCAQDTFNVPAIVRRTSNLFVFWKAVDLDSLAATARKTGMAAEAFRGIFEHFTDPHDSLWIDLTKKSPMKLRKNGYLRIVELPA